MLNPELVNKIKKLALELQPELVNIRHHLHANPELSFKEFQTAAFISKKLTEYGIAHQTGIAGTGIVGLIEGGKSNSGDGKISTSDANRMAAKKVIALRADMDALPIQEKNETPYRSLNPGVMHACGHDVHSTCLIGALVILNKLKNDLEGTVKFIFQPGEEQFPGGASLMIKAGVLENPAPSLIIGQHVQPDMEVGLIGFRSGMYMASTDEIYITVKGKGGHAALPHTYKSPLLIASAILTALDQQFMSGRDNKPYALHKDIPTVLAFGKINSEGGATNVIPDEVKLEGTFRTMDESWRKEAHQKMKKLAESVAEKMGGGCDFKIVDGYPSLSNDTKTTESAEQAASGFLGKEHIIALDLRMTSEDFSFYSQQIPACFYRLGVGNKAKGITSNVHSNTFDIDERALETGSGLMAAITISSM